MKDQNTFARPVSGFSLIELMIVIAIIGLLTAVAIPSYKSYMLQTRRSDAIIFLQEAAGEQYRFFSENNRYATDMTELGYSAGATAESKEGYYTVSIANPSATSYVMSAAPKAGGAQVSDTDCPLITVSDTGVKGPAGSEFCW